VGQGFEAPLLATNAGDGSGRLFVVEQVGRVRILIEGRPQQEPFLDISPLVSAGGERGLLGLAFHPDYGTNGRFFVNYTDTAGDTVIAEYRVSSDPDRADPRSARSILRIDQPYSNHNGGNVIFGPDGYLYIGMGDGGSAGDPHGNGQRLDTLLGKMLRIDVDGARPYTVPPDNPFARGRQGRAEIWSLGLRNPWRFSFDRETGDLWIGDVGQGELEEIDRARPGRGGSNYGWNVMEGTECFSPSEGCDRAGLVRPIAVYPTALGCAVVGGYVYRGSRFPALRGGYLFADFCAGVMFALDPQSRSPQEPVVVLETGRPISSFGEDEEGELYVTDLGSGDVLLVTGDPR
jgi:glucose/arabinose dehydrogenase